GGRMGGACDAVGGGAGDESGMRGLGLSRNFGSHLAITAGLAHAHGAAAIVLTADLQEPPEMIPEFVARWEEGNQIVWGIRSKRSDQRRVDSLFSGAFTAVTRSPPEMKGDPVEGPSADFLVGRGVVVAAPEFGHRKR